MGTPLLCFGVLVGKNSLRAGVRPQRERSAVPLRCSDPKEVSSDVVVIGSGVGGLGTAALLAKDGFEVTVLESHVHPGGAAHAFSRRGYHFDSGPSLYSGMSSRPSANPLAHLLDAVGEPVEWIKYDEWGVNIPEGVFPKRVGPHDIVRMLQEAASSDQEREEVTQQWQKLWSRIEELSAASRAVPTAAVRTDPLAPFTVLRYLPAMIQTAPSLPYLTSPFSEVLDAEQITNPLLRNWIDLLCFLLSGLPADGTLTVEAAFMLQDFYEEGAILDYPAGGGGSIVDALVRGVTNQGGKVLTGQHVEKILFDGKRASGVQTRDGTVFRAREFVISNASAWDTANLLPPGTLQKQRDLSRFVENWDISSHKQRSFMHLHLGFDAEGLKDLLCHYIHVFDWSRGVDAEQNVVLISIPSVLDPSLAPEGKHVLHAYTPGSEPFEVWSDVEYGSAEYEELKKERAEVMWTALSAIIPDIRSRIDVELVGTPLTHRRFLRRHEGSYGPAIRAGKAFFPFANTPVPGLLRCGDSVFPGIGMPAVAAGALITANSKKPLLKHLALLSEIGL